MTDKPTDEALENLFVEETGFATDDFPAAIFDFARAVLAKWGSPVVAGDVDRADAVNLARNALTQYDCAIAKKGVRVLAEAVLSMDSALTAPQPTHAQTGAVPLTAKQMESGRDAIFSTGNPYCPCDSKTFRKVAEWVERHHGITHKEGGQHVE